jgi:hypothetical protein
MALGMSKILFENKKAALGFAGAIIVGALVFSGVSTTRASSDGTESTGAEEKVEASEKSKANAGSTEDGENEDIAFAEDEELVDEASGFETSSDEELGENDEVDPPEADDADRSDRGDREDRADRRERRSSFRDFDDEGFLRLEDDSY